MRREAEYTLKSIDQLPMAIAWARQLITRGIELGPVVIRLGRESRSLSQNRKMWPMLTDISSQINWQGRRLTPGQWKELITGSFSGQEAIQGLNGGIIFIGRGESTSGMNKKKFSELIEFMYAEGTELGVKWSEKGLAVYEKYREAA